MKVKKFTKKDRYGNMMSFEFDVDSELNVQQVPPMGMGIPRYKAVGGMESNHPGDPKGSDTVPAWLTPGEFVVNKEATDIYGPIIKQMNDHGRAIQNGQKPPAQYADRGMEVIPGILPTPKPDVYNLFMKEKRMPSKFDIDRVDFTKINKYDDLIYKAAEKYGLDPEFLKAVLYTESAGKADAVGDKNMGKGNEAFGLGQISKRAFNDLVKDFPDYQFSFNSVQTHPVANIDAAAKYLSMQKNKYIPKANRGEKGWKENFIKSPEHEMHMMYQFYNAGPYEKSINAVQNANKVMAIKNKLEGLTDTKVYPGFPKDKEAGNLYEDGATTSFPGEEKYENVVPMEKPVPTWTDRAVQIKDKFMDNLRWNEGGAIPPAYLEHGGWHWGEALTTLPWNWKDNPNLGWDKWNYEETPIDSNMADSIPENAVNNNPLPSEWKGYTEEYNRNLYDSIPENAVDNNNTIDSNMVDSIPNVSLNDQIKPVPGYAGEENLKTNLDSNMADSIPENAVPGLNAPPKNNNLPEGYLDFKNHPTLGKYWFDGLKVNAKDGTPLNLIGNTPSGNTQLDDFWEKRLLRSQIKPLSEIEIKKYNEWKANKDYLAKQNKAYEAWKTFKTQETNKENVAKASQELDNQINNIKTTINKIKDGKIKDDGNTVNKLEDQKKNLEKKKKENLAKVDSTGDYKVETTPGGWTDEPYDAKTTSVNKDAALNLFNENKNEKSADNSKETENEIIKKGQNKGKKDPGALEKAEGALKSFLGPLFDTQELKRMAVLYLGSRLLGFNHGGSLQYTQH